MNMSELTKSVASSTGATETATKAMIAAVFDAIAASAAEGDDAVVVCDQNCGHAVVPICYCFSWRT